ncbi:MAG: type VI secretion system membrane subunit TssM [Myxococcaceae bacterium]
MLGYVFVAILLSFIWTVIVALGLPLWVAAVPTGVAVVSLATVLLLRRRAARQAAVNLEVSILAQGKAHVETVRPDLRPEIEGMQEEFSKAIAALKGSRWGKGGRDALSVLPWYLIIGPPGGGKSTALRNSGLQFPHVNARGGAVRGVGGTRNCDWWLTPEAVLLDTAGRYSVEEDDREEWLAFLDSLVKHRPKRPINGLLIAVSVSDLMGGDDAVQSLARRLRERVDEVMSRLRMNVPVYVLITKCDLLAGFVETFSDLAKPDRNQVWGFTTRLEEAHDVKSIFEARFDELVTQLEARCLTRLTQERRVEARARIYQFPQQLVALRHHLGEWVSTLFAEGSPEDRRVFRGCYFTSGTQEGSPIDRVMHAMAEAFGVGQSLPPPSEPKGEAKSYFLRDLFSAVLIPDQKLAARSTQEIKRQSLLRLAYASGGIALAVLLAVLPLVSFFRNRALIGAIREATASAHAESSSGLVSLASLEPLRVQVDRIIAYQREGAPWTLRFGLYQGDTLFPALRDTYAAALQKAYVANALKSDADALRTFVDAEEVSNERPGLGRYAAGYDLLKLHLLLTGPRVDGEPSVDAPTAEWMANVLASREPRHRSSSDAKLLLPHAQTYAALLATENPPLLPRDDGLVRRARNTLRKLPPAALTIERLATEIGRQEEDLTLTDLLGGSTAQLRSSGKVRAAMTRRVWAERVRPQLEGGLYATEAWVLGTAPQASPDAVASEYFQQYIQEWRDFLETIEFAPIQSNAETLALLEDLSRGKPPPLGRLFASIAHQVNLNEEEESAIGAVGDALAQKVRATLGKKKALGPIEAAQRALARRAPDRLEASDVTAAFSGLVRFGAPVQKSDAAGSGDGPPLDTYQEQLEFLRDALRADMENPEDHDPLMARLQTARVRVKSLIEMQETGWRPRLEALLWPPLDALSRSSTRELAAGASAKWCSAVVASFDQSLAKRYPFARGGQDASLADVTEFFRPEAGIVDGFYNAVLQKDVLRVGDAYQFARRLGNTGNSPYAPGLLLFLKRSHDVSASLFPPKSTEPVTEFSVHLRPSPKVASITLTIDGQQITYQNGPEQWHAVKWPGGGKKPGASISVRSNKGVSETLEQEGEWGLFRLLESGTLQGTRGQRSFAVTWKLASMDAEVTLDVRPSRSESPFVGVPRTGQQPQLLQPFRASGIVPPRGIGAGGAGCQG